MRRVSVSIITLAVSFVACSYLPFAPASAGGYPASSTPASSTPAVSPTNEPFTAIPLHVGFGSRGSWYELYFTDPANPASAQMSGGIEAPLVAAIDGARLSVHAAMYSLTLRDVRDALLRAHRRGIDVKVVMESDNLDADDPQRLKEGGIPLLGDRRQGLMHNKFIVIDGAEVWTGSMNFTSSGAYLDNNVMMRLRSQEVADDYEAEFNEMFVDDHFGLGPASKTPYPRVTIDGTLVEVYFSPDDHVETALSRLLRGARWSIQFLAYSFTSNALGEAVLRSKAAGLSVSGVMDAEQGPSNTGTELPSFQSAGLDVRLDGNPGQMHEKVMIVDGQAVVLGSYNFTASADRSNDENLIIVHDPVIAQQFADEFRRIYEIAPP
jgi:phosphatidylserine/phosphatidylglycerophosphate/cardiolipin synthase-like enzyme